MGTLDKLKGAFGSCQGPFPFKDFVRLLNQLGYEEVKRGKTGGSRRRYYNASLDHMIFLHEPHPSPDMGPAMVKSMQQQLRERGVL